MNPVDNTVDVRSRLRQALLEHDLVEHVKAALRLALSWNLREVGLSRKLLSVRFCTESLVRHLQLLMEMEEQGGYLDDVAEQKPHLCHRADQLRAEHTQLSRSAREVLAAVQSAEAETEEGLALCMRQIEILLARLDDHETREREMFFELYCEDEGGEG
jgi:uncharacterized protein (UPF0335 family)